MERRFFGQNLNASAPVTIMFVGVVTILGHRCVTSPIPELRVKTLDHGLGDGGAVCRHPLGGIIVQIIFPFGPVALVSMDLMRSFFAPLWP
jgi:hypothetical protein